MDLSQYKMIRTKKFPLPKPHKPPTDQSHPPTDQSHPQPQPPTTQKPDFIKTIGLLSSYEPETYQMHIDQPSTVVLFNEHQFLKRSFSFVYQLPPDTDTDEGIDQSLVTYVDQFCIQEDVCLLVINALYVVPVEHIIFPWKQYVAYYSILAKPDDREKQESEEPISVARALVENVLYQKKPNTVVTLSIVAIRADGSLEDELNYDWIEDNKYADDLMKIREKSKLKVKKYRSEVKVCDLNRQQIKQWEEAREILYHYSQIKEYLEVWKQELDSPNNPKIGEVYEVCEVSVDEELGFITEVHKRKCLLKLNQFMPASNLVMMKITQLLKQKVDRSMAMCGRDFPLQMFLKDCFDKEIYCHYTVFSQLGTNKSLKEQAICLSMDLQIPGTYTYLKNYCDKPKIIAQVKQKAKNFIPLTTKQKTEMKLVATQINAGKLKADRKQVLKQGEFVASKSFCYDTYSSHNKKRMSAVTEPQNQYVMKEPVDKLAVYNTFQRSGQKY